MKPLRAPAEGVCRYCNRRRDVYRIGRYGGGTYRRGGRTYRSSLCGLCAIRLAQYTQPGYGSSVSGFDGSRILEIAAALTGVFRGSR